MLESLYLGREDDHSPSFKAEVNECRYVPTPSSTGYVPSLFAQTCNSVRFLTVGIVRKYYFPLGQILIGDKRTIVCGRECTLQSRPAPLNYEPHPTANLYNRSATNLTTAKKKTVCVNNSLLTTSWLDPFDALSCSMSSTNSRQREFPPPPRLVSTCSLQERGPLSVHKWADLLLPGI